MVKTEESAPELGSRWTTIQRNPALTVYLTLSADPGFSLRPTAWAIVVARLIGVDGGAAAPAPAPAPPLSPRDPATPPEDNQ